MITRNIAVVLSGRDAGLARTLGAAAGALHTFQTSVDSTNARSGRLITGLKLGLAALGVVAVIAFGAAVNSAINFEQSMRNANTVARLSEQDFRAASQAVLDLSTRVPQSATVLADGLRDIAGSGFQGADALQILEVSSKAASAGITETRVASQAIVSVLNAYGLGAEHAADVSDVLFRTVDKGVIEFEDLAMQLGEVVAGAAAAGIEIDEVGAALAAMTLSGLQASEATTSLNRLIRELIQPSDALATAFNNLGFESGLAALEQLGLFGTMERLRLATGGQVEEFLKLFPEIRAARGAFALAAANGTNYARVQEVITDETKRAGATNEAFKEQMKAVGNQFILFRNEIQRVGINLASSLLPRLNDLLDWAREVGPPIGRFFSELRTRAEPALRSLGGAVLSVVDFLKSFAQTMRPVATALGALAFGTVTAGLKLFGDTLSAVAGFLAEHPGLVKAVAAVYGGVLLGRLLAAAGAFIRVQAGLLAVRAGLTALTVGGLLSNLATRIGFIGLALGDIARLRVGASISTAATAFSGLGTALSAVAVPLAGVAIVGGIIAMADALDKAQRKAKAFADEITSGVDTSDLDSVENALADLDEEIFEATIDFQNLSGTGNRVTMGFRAMFENLTPLPNKVADTSKKVEELKKAQDELREIQTAWIQTIDDVSAALGISTTETEKWLSQLEGFDPLDPANKTKDLADAIRLQMAAARAGTPATDKYAGALETAADITASATDRAEAFNDALESMIGTILGVNDAARGFEQGLDDIVSAAEDTGVSFDITTQKGRDFTSAIDEAAGAALEHAAAVLEESGSIADASDVLEGHRERLIKVLGATIGNEEKAREYIDTLGLTPDNIETALRLSGADTAQEDLDLLNLSLDAIDQARATGTVRLDSSDFDGKVDIIGTVLAQIGLAEPEATVLLDDKPFQATAAQVNAWAALWDDNTPEAQAILDIIDPKDKFDTLSEAANNWDKQSPTAKANVDGSDGFTTFERLQMIAGVWGLSVPTATADVDNRPAKKEIEEGQGILDLWDRSSGSARITGDNREAARKIAEAQDKRRRWDRSKGTARINANNDQAARKIAAAQGKRRTWDRSKGTADITARDLASGKISLVELALGRLDGKTATTTITTVQRFIPVRGPMRFGGIVGIDQTAQNGLLQAGVVNQPTVLFGERETGGEAFIPRRGNPNRSLSVLAQAASWFGMELRPRGEGVRAGGIINDNRSFVTVQVNARGSITDQRGLIGAIRDVTRSEMEAHDRKLVRELVSR